MFSGAGTCRKRTRESPGCLKFIIFTRRIFIFHYQNLHLSESSFIWNAQGPALQQGFAPAGFAPRINAEIIMDQGQSTILCP